VDHRGALLGPEESGLTHRTLWGSWGLVLFLLGSQAMLARLSWCGGWLGPALTKPLVWVFVLGVLFPWDGCSRLLIGGGCGVGGPARILRTV
jgi:hypothetical protein